jgi:glyoxylase-like metal-dependent hydrolase (beta-lactamase superfamily II)
MSDITVKLLREGTRIDEHKGGMKISRACCGAIVLLKSGKDCIIVDPGAMGYGDEVLAKLANEGLTPKDINIVVNTHMHLDHTFNNYLFPNAVIYTPTSVWHSDEGNRVEMYNHPVDLGIPGIRTLDTPGHMEKHISLIVSSKGKKIVIAGDAIRESIIQSERVPKKYPHPKQYVESMRMIFKVADEIIPGHGPIIRQEKLKTLKKRLAATKA